MEELCKSLLSDWCDALLKLQIKGTGRRELDGAVWCSACGKIHGRCFEAMYPLLSLAHACRGKKREKLVEAANGLFSWARINVSRPDGSFLNDTYTDWKGTTVFNAIQLADCLWFHGEILSDEVKKAWIQRLRQAADFLCNFKELRENNINYPISNALALLECGMVLKDQYYIRKARDWMDCFKNILTENGLVYGEGIPRERRSLSGCLPVDIGYNVEETLPSMALYGFQAKDEEVIQLAREAMKNHLEFMLEDGGWDNSFGTRNFKWTYWGSRTTDGCALGYLLYAEENPEFARAAEKNLKLLRRCTIQGLLAGGPHYEAAGQGCCVHHTFTHAKAVAGILDRKLYLNVWKMNGTKDGERRENLEQMKSKNIRHYEEVNTWIVKKGTMRATITAYDWEYIPDGHVSGGTLSLLYEERAGVLFCAGMETYWRKEPANMQIPKNVIHECLALRIEEEWEGEIYSSLYDDKAVVWIEGDWICVEGELKNVHHSIIPGGEERYKFRYWIKENELDIVMEFDRGKMICPLISQKEEKINIQSVDGIECRLIDGLILCKESCAVRMSSDTILKLPYGTERIFNLVPGMQALRIDAKPENGYIHMKIEILEYKGQII